ncbi:MAG: hypothetical protein P8J91_19160 [Pirellulaceae bacterium]|nr:hypothetical protein [Pirellulaceae bacterium]MDG2105881.1 hypothetical protein [Pirellulaceae bacterium]
MAANSSVTLRKTFIHDLATPAGYLRRQVVEVGESAISLNIDTSRSSEET